MSKRAERKRIGGYVRKEEPIMTGNKQQFHYDLKYGPHTRPLEQYQFHTCELEDCKNKVSWYVMCDVRSVKELSQSDYIYGFVTTECGRQISSPKEVRYILGEVADLWLCDKHKDELTECGCLNGYYFQVNPSTYRAGKSESAEK